MVPSSVSVQTRYMDQAYFFFWHSFEDSVIVLEINGETLRDTLEGTLKPWPAQEG